MDYQDAGIPDFASVLSLGDESSHETHRSNVSTKISDVMEHQTDAVHESTEQPDSSCGSESDADSSEDESASESESESEDEESVGDDDESESEEDSSDGEDDASESEYASDSSYESLQASKTIRVEECDNATTEEEHVYEDDEQGEDEEEVCYEDTDLGGEEAATASIIAASLVAGGGAVRSGTGWTWTSIFIVLSAAGGLGLVLLYAIKRINDLTRLVKTLEENGHMAISERDVQVITTQVIGDMLQDSEGADNPNIEKEETAQTEFDRFVEEEKEAIEKPQSMSELLENDYDDDDDDDDEVMSHCSAELDGAEGKEDVSIADIAVETDEEEKIHDASVTHAVEEKVEEVLLQKPLGAVEGAKRSPVNEKGETESPLEKTLGAAREEMKSLVSEKGKSESDVDDLATMVETLSLSDDVVTTRKSSRLITANKVV